MIFAVAKKVRDSRLDSRAAREKLKPSGKPYYRPLELNLHLGYRKGKHGGKWVMRCYVGDEKYVVETIGVADDVVDADGVETLDFHQAQDRARERARAIAEEARIASLGPAITVGSAILEEYLPVREKCEARNHGAIGLQRDARSRLTKHLLEANEKLAAKPLGALTTDDLAKWRDGLRMAPGSVQRTTNDLRAALNLAAKRHKAQLPPTIRDTIKDGLASVHAAPAAAREAQVLRDADVRALVSAAWEIDAACGWGGDLGRIVLTLAGTGARYSQVIRMTVADVQAAQKRLMVPASFKGRGVKNSSHIAVRIGDDVLAALATATAGRKGSEPLLTRSRRENGERGPWRSAELRRPWAEIVERAGLAGGTVMYALRHSSITRGLRAGLPVRLIAALHDTSTQMIEAHYSAYIVDAMDELAARAIVPLTTSTTTVVRLERA